MNIFMCVIEEEKTINNCIMLYGRWVPGISRGLHCDQPGPRQCDAPMAGNPPPPSHGSPRSLPGTRHTELTVEMGRVGGAERCR